MACSAGLSGSVTRRRLIRWLPSTHACKKAARGALMQGQAAEWQPPGCRADPAEMRKKGARRTDASRKGQLANCALFSMNPEVRSFPHWRLRADPATPDTTGKRCP